MAAKLVQISDDGGSNYYTLPGNQGEFRDELGELDDTIFGQNFKSGQPNLIGWSCVANALYKGFAGYTVSIKQQGTSTTMTGEAMSLVSGKTYKTTNAAKNVWDRTATFTVYGNGIAIANSNILNIDFLFGQVTFQAAYTPTTPITVDGKYLAMTQLAKYRSFTLTQTQEPIDNTDIPTAQTNSGHKTYGYGLKTVSLECAGVYASSNGYRAALVARSEILIEINPDNSAKSVARGFFKPSTRSQKGNVGELEEETAAFVLSVPTTSLLKTPFRWEFSSSTDLSTSVQKALNAWLNETTLKVQYMPDGVTGLRGDCVVSDISLSGGLEAMNEFKCTLMGTGAVTAF